MDSNTNWFEQGIGSRRCRRNDGAIASSPFLTAGSIFAVIIAIFTGEIKVTTT
ncbi:hypothetical protein EJD97_006248 [Solanum chilense]|uniref:Uncharacterized protein n=1 Tax=Solanum chilense TaxID=4083 RepID=A0A6N2CJU9_SOLCI|nr:hypothetical protein EJD97_006248 [Solanum chilense]